MKGKFDDILSHFMFISFSVVISHVVQDAHNIFHVFPWLFLCCYDAPQERKCEYDKRKIKYNIYENLLTLYYTCTMFNMIFIVF